MQCQVCGGNHHPSAHSNGHGLGQESDPFLTDQYLTDPYQTGEDFDHPEMEESSVEYIQSAEDAFKEPEILHAEITAGTEQPTYQSPMERELQTPQLPKASGIATDLMSLAQAASSGDAQTIFSAVEQFSKSQLVRFLDITIIGPMLLVWAYRGRLSTMERFLMGVIGAGTVIYNGRNYLKNKQILQPQQISAIKKELQSSIMSGRY